MREECPGDPEDETLAAGPEGAAGFTGAPRNQRRRLDNKTDSCASNPRFCFDTGGVDVAVGLEAGRGVARKEGARSVRPLSSLFELHAPNRTTLLKTEIEQRGTKESRDTQADQVTIRRRGLQEHTSSERSPCTALHG